MNRDPVIAASERAAAAPDARPAPVLLELDRIDHAYGDRPVVRDLSLRLRLGQIGCLLGPSGCGKTTVLRCIAGFERVRQGEIRLADRRVSSPREHAPPEQRRIGMVFQDYALFPHLTAAANIAFGLGRWGRRARSARVNELLRLVGLEQAGGLYPHQLSGGQQQRVALARALAPRPELLLLDEPFSNLDVELRERLSVELRTLLKSQNATAILVTHDQQEAFAIADDIGVMADGELQQWDTPYNLYHKPANRFVADFIGQGVFLEGRVIGPRRLEIELGGFSVVIPHDCASGCAVCAHGGPVEVLLRPDAIVPDDHGPLQAEVLHKAFRGPATLYRLRLPGGQEVLALASSHYQHAAGEQISVRLAADKVTTFHKPPG